MKRRFWQISEFLQKNNAITSSTFRWLGDEGLARILSHMVLKISDLIRQKKRVRHEFVIDWEESLKPTDDDAEYILFSKVVHQRIPIENALAHLDDVEVVISQGHAVPQDGAVSRLICLLVSVFANNILNCVKFTSTMICIDNYISFSNFGLLLSIHQMIWMNVVNWSLVHHHWYCLTWYYLWVLTINIWYRTKAAASFFYWVLLMTLSLVWSGLLLRVSIRCVLLLLLLRTKTIAASRAWYFIIWLLLKLLLRKLVLTDLALVFGSTAWPFLLVVGVSSIMTCRHLVNVGT